jgi:hypothetical protein
MTDYTIEFAADVEMTGEHPHPPVLTTRVRPNLLVGGKFFPCALTETNPNEGISERSKGSITATALCPAEDVERFVTGAGFELRAGPSHRFAKRTFRKIGPRAEYSQTPTTG